MGQDAAKELPRTAISAERVRGITGNAAVGSRYHPVGSGRCLTKDYTKNTAVLGKGRHSTVMTVHRNIDQRKCALKAYHKQMMSREAIGLMVSEAEILLAIDHPHIVRLYDVYEPDHETLYMILECCTGGELYFHLMQRGRLSEAEVASLARQMLSAISYLHTYNITHRDLKLENFLFASEDLQMLKLIDFGFATVWDTQTALHVPCGTRDYVGPEVLKPGGYTTQCDMWSFGVIVFMLLTGCAPMQADTTGSLQSKIRRAEVNWHMLERKCQASEEARSFLGALLVKDPNVRFTAATAMLHPWLIRSAAAKEAIMLRPSLLRSLHSYTRDNSRLRRAALQLIGQHLTVSQAKELTDVFLELSDDTGGTISVRRLKKIISFAAQTASDAYKYDRAIFVAAFGETELSNIVDELFSTLDTIGEGQISYSDFLAAAMDPKVAMQEEALRLAFWRLDQDGSGTISAGDLQAVLGPTTGGTTAEEVLKEIDPRAGTKGLDFQAFCGALRDVPEAKLASPFPPPKSPRDVSPECPPTLLPRRRFTDAPVSSLNWPSGAMLPPRVTNPTPVAAT